MPWIVYLGSGPKPFMAIGMERSPMTGKQLHIASWIDAAMQALTQTGEDDIAVLADMKHCSHSG